MRILESALVGLLALSAPTAALAAPPIFHLGPAAMDPTPGVALVRDVRSSGWQPAPGHLRQGRGASGPPHWRQNWNSGWGPYLWPGAPTYWVWGPAGGAFDYPFADWRGPTGGWGNP